MSVPSVFAASLGLLAVATTFALAAPDPLAPQRNRERVLLVSAPDERDPHLVVQRRAFRSMADGAAERDLVLVEAVGRGTRAVAIRSAYGLDDGAFAALLIGKDGGVKLRSSAPLNDDQLFTAIDAMPMRRDEMSRAKSGKAR